MKGIKSPVQTIEQMRQDPRPLVSISNASAVTGRPLGSLLMQLATADACIFIECPKNVHIYCVVPQPETVLRSETLPPHINDQSSNNETQKHLKNIKETIYANASHFSYVALSPADIRPFINGQKTTSVDNFSHAVNVDYKKEEISLVSAGSYIRGHAVKESIPLSFKAKFAAYYPEYQKSSALYLGNFIVHEEELLISKKSLIDISQEASWEKGSYPDELASQLQPWKSCFLKAMNIAAYKISLGLAGSKNHDTSPENILTAEMREEASKTKISVAVTILAHNRKPLSGISHIAEEAMERYPSYFSSALIYLNEKCHSLKDDYINNHDSRPPKVDTLVDELFKEGNIPINTARRIATDIRPNYEKASHS